MAVLTQVKTSVRMLALLSVLTGVIYPLFVTLVAQQIFSAEANGSLIIVDGKNIGSALIGQHFDAPQYFWGRPSATQPYAYNAANSTGSNFGPSNPEYLNLIKLRIQSLQQTNPDHRALVPMDLITASGSGLDPDITPAAAFYQAARVAAANHLTVSEIEMLINRLISNRTMGIFGEPRVNVLTLNLALDQLRSAHGRSSSKSR
jgi:K+-transporting ATPase ATPase C chain